MMWLKRIRWLVACLSVLGIVFVVSIYQQYQDDPEISESLAKVTGDKQREQGKPSSFRSLLTDASIQKGYEIRPSWLKEKMLSQWSDRDEAMNQIASQVSDDAYSVVWEYLTIEDHIGLMMRYALVLTDASVSYKSELGFHAVIQSDAEGLKSLVSKYDDFVKRYRQVSERPLYSSDATHYIVLSVCRGGKWDSILIDHYAELNHDETVMDEIRPAFVKYLQQFAEVGLIPRVATGREYFQGIEADLKSRAME